MLLVPFVLLHNKSKSTPAVKKGSIKCCNKSVIYRTTEAIWIKVSTAGMQCFFRNQL